MKRFNRHIALLLVIAIISSIIPTNVFAVNELGGGTNSKIEQSVQNEEMVSLLNAETNIEEEETVNGKERLKTENSTLEDNQEEASKPLGETTEQEEVIQADESVLEDSVLKKETLKKKELIKSTQNKIKNDSKIIGEVTEKRNSNVKHFLKKNNTYEAVIYSSPVHYYEDGKWKDIDNQLTEEVSKENHSVFQNKANDFKVRIAKNAKAKDFIRITKDKYELTWDMMNINKISGEKKEKDLSHYNKLNSNEKKKSLTKLDSSIIYEDAYEGVDIEYNIVSQSIKENIIIKSSSALEKEFTAAYHIRTKNLVVEKQEDNTILLFDEKDSKNTIFKIDAPFMFDGVGEISNNVIVTIREEKGGYTVTYKPDMEWLKDSARIYPITIDPTVRTSIERTDIKDGHISQGFPTTNYQNAIYLKSGYGSSSLKNRSYMKFTLPELTSADTVIYADLQLALASTITNTYEIDVHKVTSTWDSSTLTWNKQPTYDTNIIDDYINVNSTEDIYTFEITKLVKDWYTTGTNHGLMIKNKNESSGYTEFYSSDTSNQYESLRPVVSLMYVNNSGIEDYWSYHNQDLGRAGTGYVNDYNGNLVFIHDDVSSNGNRMPVNIYHVYNSNTHSTNTGYGKGWRLNLSQTITKATIDSVVYCVYTDEDGTIHYLEDTGNGTYEDEGGIDLTLTENLSSTTERYVIKDKEDNSLVFDSTGKLKKITDNNNNRIELIYTNNLLTSVIHEASD